MGEVTYTASIPICGQDNVILIRSPSTRVALGSTEVAFSHEPLHKNFHSTEGDKALLLDQFPEFMEKYLQALSLFQNSGTAVKQVSMPMQRRACTGFRSQPEGSLHIRFSCCGLTLLCIALTA